MNISCITLTAMSMIIYKLYEINCPCQPGYNLTYGLVFTFFPPLTFFFFAFILSQRFVPLLLDLSKPMSKRRKSQDVLSLALKSIIIKALVAPILWIIVCLLDGKSIICAFSETIDAEQFGGFGNFTSLSTDLLLAKVPCKNFELLRSSSTRKAIHRFLKSVSQAVGFLMILSLMVFAIVSHLLSSIFNITTSIRARYWTVFSDTEDQCFEEICQMYNCWMAERRIRSSFEDVEKHGVDKETHGGDKKIISPWQMMDYIDQWHSCPPPVSYGHEALGPQLTDKLH